MFANPDIDIIVFIVNIISLRGIKVKIVKYRYIFLSVQSSLFRKKIVIRQYMFKQ